MITSSATAAILPVRGFSAVVDVGLSTISRLEATKANSLRVEGLRIYLLQPEKFIAGGKAAYTALRKHFKDSDDENSLRVIN
jgi:hypothetical protein